jgi:hypothetical protein
MANTQKRIAARNRCLRTARFVFNGGNSSLDATVRNISRTGAQLLSPDMRIVPDEFLLIISNGAGSYDRRQARKIWMRAGAMGVAFVDEQPAVRKSRGSKR